MKWKINSAIHIGKDHEFMKKNLQDFLYVYENDWVYVGVICDGCSEGEHSEFGAALIGKFVAQYISENPMSSLITDVESLLLSFLNRFVLDLKILKVNEFVDFVKNYLLATLIFCVILKIEKKIVIGNSGDGVVIKNNQYFGNDQNDKPHYLAYQIIPNEYLEKVPNLLEKLKIEIFSIEELNNIVIASDGLKPFLESHVVEELYGKSGRQLQRLINVIQSKEKIFSDDISCIVFEKEMI